MNIFLFSYRSTNAGRVEKCLEFHVIDKYEVRHMNENIFIIKKQGETSELKAQLSNCLYDKEHFSFIELRDYAQSIDVQDDEWLIVLKNMEEIEYE
ncbi:hypothetical protein [Metabacillus idriensis]|uniref:hypothetical protein n=1 Tax=Metabacillus idriensis TaxID=324768 RepID=UPI001747F316|nr:hypothetical protein [Metabacillus idriensis]